MFRDSAFAQMIAIDMAAERCAAMAERYDTALDAMGVDARANTEDARYRAVSYYWGRVDAGDTPRFDELEFGLAYGLHAAAFYGGQASNRLPYRDAYRILESSGRIDPSGF